MRAVLTEESIRWLHERRVFTHVKGGARLRPGEQVRFHHDTVLEPYVGFYEGATFCSMGFMSYSVSPLPTELTVGRYCSIGPGSQVILGRHNMAFVSTAPVTASEGSILAHRFAEDYGIELPDPEPLPEPPAPVIEHDVWIGARVTILAGVRIAKGAVVGAGCVVTRDVGPYEVVAGNPARLVRKRFPDEVIQALTASEWWRYRFRDFKDLPFDRAAPFAEAFLKRKADLKPYEPEPIMLAGMPRKR